MKFLVTGATGFLGSHLVKSLLKDGFEIIILKRSSSNISRIAKILPWLYVYDLDKCELDKPFREHGAIDGIIHTATCYGRKNEKISDVFEANVIFPLTLLDLASCFNVKTFLNTDTYFNSGLTSYKYLHSYVLSKKHFKECGHCFSDQKKIQFVNIKLHHIYGPKDDESKFTTYIMRSCLNNMPEIPLTPGNQKRDFIYVDDVTSAYKILFNKVLELNDYFFEYDIGSGEAVTIRQFVENVHSLSSSKSILKFGALPYRENEIMHSQANIEPLSSLGWSQKICLIEGIKKVLREERKKLVKT